jgi:hypothetical protein
MGTRWTTAIQRAVDDVVHAGPGLETAGEAFQPMAKQAGARGRATDAAVSVAKAVPNGGAGAWGMPVGSLEPPGMIPVVAFFLANSDTFWHASPLG